MSQVLLLAQEHWAAPLPAAALRCAALRAPPPTPADRRTRPHAQPQTTRRARRGAGWGARGCWGAGWTARGALPATRRRQAGRYVRVGARADSRFARAARGPGGGTGPHFGGAGEGTRRCAAPAPARACRLAEALSPTPGCTASGAGGRLGARVSRAAPRDPLPLGACHPTLYCRPAPPPPASAAPPPHTHAAPSAGQPPPSDLSSPA